jgi:hypothetical protein
MLKITIWEEADIQCVALVVNDELSVQILAGKVVRRERRVKSADEAIHLARIWKTAQPESPSATPLSDSKEPARADRRGPRRVTRGQAAQQNGRAAKTRMASDEPTQPVRVRRYPMGAARGIIW